MIGYLVPAKNQAWSSGCGCSPPLLATRHCFPINCWRVPHAQDVADAALRSGFLWARSREAWHRSRPSAATKISAGHTSCCIPPRPLTSRIRNSSHPRTVGAAAKTCLPTRQTPAGRWQGAGPKQPKHRCGEAAAKRSISWEESQPSATKNR